MALGVLIEGIDGFGAELWFKDIFWWDAWKVKTFLGAQLKPDESWNEGAAHIQAEEMRKLMEMFPVRFEQHQRHYDELAELIEQTEYFKVAVYEWSSE